MGKNIVRMTYLHNGVDPESLVWSNNCSYRGNRGIIQQNDLPLDQNY